jgi:hypothetical protein
MARPQTSYLSDSFSSRKIIDSDWGPWRKGWPQALRDHHSIKHRGNFFKLHQNVAIKLDGRAATLVIDNLRVHYSKKVTEVMAKHPNLKFLYLPIYNCWLNTIERLWNIFKQKWRLKASDIEDYQPSKLGKMISMLETVIDGTSAATCINVF